MKVVLIVIDSFGIGELPDAALYGDEGSNTYKNIYEKTKVKLDNLTKIGLNNIEGVDIPPHKNPIGSYARLAPKTPAKDTTAGHYELAGIVTDKPYRTFEKFPQEIVRKIEKLCNCKFIGNVKASGTEIINILGEKHRKTKKPILYTSADSVMQIAADTEIIPLERLYEICRAARQVMQGDYAVGRIIARPFVKTKDSFVRTAERKDYALNPPEPTMLDKLSSAGFDCVGVGKISEIFNGQGITKSYKTKNNQEGIDKTIELLKADINGLIFVNLVDTDMLYGHRNDYLGYAKSLKHFDSQIPKIISKLNCGDLLMLTADHGCDPTTQSTDHSREYVPLLLYSNDIKTRDFKTIDGFDIVSKTVLDYFGIGKGDGLQWKN